MNILKTALAICFLAWSAIPARAGDTITIVADEWPPFSGENLHNGGISLDVIATTLRRAGYTVETAILPWARIMDGARKGEHDVVGSLFFDPDIAQYMTYGESFYQTEVKFVQKKGAGLSVQGLDSLRPYSIAVGDGFLYEEQFDRADYLDKVVVRTALQGILMVAHGRADLTLDSQEVIRYSVHNHAPEIADDIEFLPGALATHDIHMAVSNTLPNREDVVADFNRVLAEMRADGSLAELLAKHQVR